MREPTEPVLAKTPAEAYDFPRTHSIEEVQNFLSTLDPSETTVPTEVAIAGRITSTRPMGRLRFDTLSDSSGTIQIISMPDDTEAYEDLGNTQVGDWIGFVGKAGFSKTGEPSVYAEDWSYLARTEVPFPSFREGLRDPEIRTRQRYLDLAVNRDSMERFKQRSKVVSTMRSFMEEHGFMEVETPTFHPVAGGASARPFVTHHNSLDTDFYLRIAPELYLKRLVVGGLERVYEIGKSFRNEGISSRHNPEFTMMEVYAAYWDCEDQMSFTERLVERAVQAVHGNNVIDYQGTEIDFTTPWDRGTMADLTSSALGEAVDIHTDISRLRAICDTLKIPYREDYGTGKLLTEIYEATVEGQLDQPTFVTEYPTEVSPLAREHRDKPGYTERFEGIVARRELCNGYTELNDATTQLERFIDQADPEDVEAMGVDHDFVKALRYGLPPTGGMGIGIDRLAMLVGNTASIKDVILFPSLKPEASIGVNDES